jgi:UDP-N-acetyl-D-glucosamine dehydrogenase
MPHYVIIDALNTRRKAVNGAKILLAGVAYKREIDDIRESPALDIMGLLHTKGAIVAYADPFVPSIAARDWPGGYQLQAVDLGRGSIAQYDCVVIVTEHKAFDYDALVAEADVIVDTRNAIKKPYAHVFRLGAAKPAAQSLIVDRSSLIS